MDFAMDAMLYNKCEGGDEIVYLRRLALSLHIREFESKSTIWSLNLIHVSLILQYISMEV